jgi:hypothetical protein
MRIGVARCFYTEETEKKNHLRRPRNDKEYDPLRALFWRAICALRASVANLCRISYAITPSPLEGEVGVASATPGGGGSRAGALRT